MENPYFGINFFDFDFSYMSCCSLHRSEKKNELIGNERIQIKIVGGEIQCHKIKAKINKNKNKKLLGYWNCPIFTLYCWRRREDEGILFHLL